MEQNKAPYDLDRQSAKISAYQFLTGKDVLLERLVTKSVVRWKKETDIANKSNVKY